MRPSGAPSQLAALADHRFRREGFPVQQIKGMLRDTWWLWLLFCLLTTFLVFCLSPFFAFIYPVLMVVCVYFALGRYDEHGNERQDF